LIELKIFRKIEIGKIFLDFQTFNILQRDFLVEEEP